MNAGYIARSSSVNFWAAEYTSMRCLQGNSCAPDQALLERWPVVARLAVDTGAALHVAFTRDELREILWLITIIAGLSMMGVGLAVVLTQA